MAVPGLAGGVRKLVASYRANYALKDDGSVWTWLPGPTPSATRVTTIDQVVDLVADDTRVVALRADGNVYVSDDLLGSISPVSGLADCVAVAAGNSFTLVARVDGTLWAFGQNTSGQTGTVYHKVNEYHADPARVAYFRFGPFDTTVDVDSDGLSDFDEVNTWHTDPTMADSDGDDLTDRQEVMVYHTDPNKADTDGDKMTDGWEVRYGLDPLNPNDAGLDGDGDGLTNLEEYNLKSDPTQLSTANDGIPDGWKRAYGLPVATPGSVDSDGDGLTDAQEYQLGTNPGKYSTAGDGIPDGWKVTYGFNPFLSRANMDSDNDGVSDADEFRQGSDPTNKYSNGSSVPDGDRGYPALEGIDLPKLPDVFYAAVVTAQDSEQFDYPYPVLNDLNQVLFTSREVSADRNPKPPKQYIWSQGHLNPVGNAEANLPYFISSFNSTGSACGFVTYLPPVKHFFFGQPLESGHDGEQTFGSHAMRVPVTNSGASVTVGIPEDLLDLTPLHHGSSGAERINNNGAIIARSTLSNEESVNEYNPYTLEPYWTWIKDTTVLDEGESYYAARFFFLAPGGQFLVGQSDEKHWAVHTETLNDAGQYLAVHQPAVGLDLNSSQVGILGADTDLIQPLPGDDYIDSQSINNNGYVVGRSYKMPYRTPSQYHLFIYRNGRSPADPFHTSHPHLHSLQTLTSTTRLTSAKINDQGEMLVNMVYNDLSAGIGLFRNNKNISPKELANKAGLSQLSIQDINNIGVISGHCEKGQVLLVPYQLDIISIDGAADSFTVQAKVTVPEWDPATRTTRWIAASDGTKIVWSAANGTVTQASSLTANGVAQTRLLRGSRSLAATINASVETLRFYDQDGTTGVNSSLDQIPPGVLDYGKSGPPLGVEDGAGPRYRKIAWNGRPMSDSKPHQQAESDHAPEESYVDALSLTLRHAVTDVYVPVGGSDLVLSVRRNYQGEVWDDRTGLAPEERPDLPFGAGWTSSLAANIHFTYELAETASSLTQSADYATVTDEDGSTYRFVIAYPPTSVNGTNAAYVNHVEFFPLPDSRTEQESYYTSLKEVGFGKYVFTKKYGSELTFSLMPALDKSVETDRYAAQSSVSQIKHQFARLDKVTDRTGNQLDYSYIGYDTIIPSQISNHANLSQAITIQRTGQRITSVFDPRQNRTDYSYQDTESDSNDYSYSDPYSVLTKVIGSSGGVNPAPLTQYTYDEALEPNHNEVDLSKATEYHHVNLKQLIDPRGNTYAFTYEFDLSRQVNRTGVLYPQGGAPRNVSTVTLPGTNGHATFANHSWVYLTPDFDGSTNVSYTGYRASFVTDAEGNGSLYEFTDNQVIALDKVLKYVKPAQLTSPFNFNYLVLHGKMKVTSFRGANLTFNAPGDPYSYTTGGSTSPLGSELFTFNPNAGMALQSILDFSGNTTSWTYTDTWSPTALHPWYDGHYPVGLQGDPNQQTDALNHNKTFHYATYGKASQLLDSTVDEEGRTTQYTLDALGRHTGETVKDPGGVVVQHVRLDYGSAQFPSFVTRKTVMMVGTADDTAAGPWCQSLVTAYDPDASGYVAKTTVDPDGLALATQYTYDSSGNKLTSSDPRGFVTTFRYDGRNQLYEVDYPAEPGSPVVPKKSFAYDPNGNKDTETDENNHVTTFEFDGLNRLKTSTRKMADNHPLVTAYEYNKVNSRTKVTDPRGYATNYTYDVLQRLESQTDALLHTTTFSYEGANSGASAFDSSGFKPITVTDPRGHTDVTEYDALYRPVRHTASAAPLPPSLPPTITELNAVTDIGYDKVGNARCTTAYKNFPADAQKTWVEYDALNRPTKTIYADGQNTRIGYTSTGLKANTVNELGEETDLRYDGAGRLVETLSPPPDPMAPTARPSVKAGYDASSNIISVTDARNAQSVYCFDRRSRKIEEKQPAVFDYDSQTNLQPRLRWVYDGVGNVITTSDARENQAETMPTSQHRTDTVYDWANRPVTVTAPRVPVILPPDGTPAWAQPSTTTTYDENGNVLTVTDPNGHQTVNSYDVLNRLLATTDAEGHTVNYEYDEVGNRTVVRDADSTGTSDTTHRTKYDYDGLRRNVLVTDALGRTTTFAFDGINKVSRLDAKGQTTNYSYDVRNRVTQLEYPASAPENRTYGYDAAGRLTSVADASNSAAVSVSYDYDGLGRVVSEKSNGATHTYSYDPNGNRTGVHYGNIGGPDGGGRQIVSSYDALNRLETLVENGSATTHYFYDLDGHVRSKALASGETEVTSYDALGRQNDSTDQAANGAPLYSYNYGHDAAGNLCVMSEYKPGLAANTRTTTMLYDGANRLLTEAVYNGATAAAPAQVTSTTYAYDAAGNRISKSVGGLTTTYISNALNQLESFTEAPGRHVSFTYDENGNRATRQEGSAAADIYSYDTENRLLSLGKDGVTYAYQYDYRTRRTVRTEGAVSTQVVFSGGTSVQEYTGAATAPTVEFVRGSDWGGGVGGILYSIRGGSRSLDHYDARGDVTTQTSGAGTITYQAEYEAYGTLRQEFDSDHDRQRANTKEEDPTGLLNEGMRYRDLETGCFITRDPAGMVDGPNLYAYVNHNPWTKFDPEGLSIADDFKDYAGVVGNALKNEVVGAVDFAYDSTAGAVEEVGKVGLDYYNYAKTGSTNWQSASARFMQSQLDADNSASDIAINTAAHFFPGYEMGKQIYFDASAGDMDGFSRDMGGLAALSAASKVLGEAGNEETTGNTCFGATTLIKTSNGEKPISEIEVGEWVLAEDTNSGRIDWRPVAQTFAHRVHELLILTVEDSVIETTANHPFWIIGAGWKPAGTLHEGDILETAEKDQVNVTKSERKFVETTVYNFEVDEYHTYFVSSLEVLVHNKPALSRNVKIVKNADGTSRFEQRTNGNSTRSAKPQHGYEIVETATSDVVKTGVSDSKLTTDGRSPRATKQVNAWNKQEGAGKYTSKVKVAKRGRPAILNWEERNAQRLKNQGNSMNKHQKP